MSGPRVVWTSGCLLALAATLGAQSERPIPDRPEELTLPPLVFQPPPAASFRHELSNGVVVFVVEDRTVPLVELTLVAPVGGQIDPPDKVGLASLTGSMLRRGGTAQLEADAFDERVDFLGARLDSFGGDSRSGFTLDCSTEQFEAVLDLLVQALRSPAFEEERLEVARANLASSLAARDDDPLNVLRHEWTVLLWGTEHPRARRLTESSLSAIERSDLVDFHSRHWSATGAVIAVSGDVETSAVLRLLEARLGDWPRSDTDDAHGDAGRAVPPRQMAEPGLYHVQRDTSQVKVLLGHEGARRESWLEPQGFELIVLSELLGGGGPVSRLRRVLRAQEGLSYRVQGSLGIGWQSEGDFEVFLETDPSSLALALELVVAEIERLRREPPSKQELELVQRSLIDAFPLLFDSAIEIAGRYAEDVLVERPHEYWRLYRDGVEAVEPEDVQRVARRYLEPQKLRALVVGPWSEVDEKKLARLFGGRVTRLSPTLE